MLNKRYFSRSESKFIATHGGYVGDPFGGAAYGELNDPATAIVASAALTTGGSLIAGNQAADATQSAADTAAAAQNRATDLQEKQYNQGYADAAPYRDITQQALYRYADDLGLGGNRPAGWVAQPKTDAFNNYQDTDVYKNSVAVGEKAIGRISPVYDSGSRLKALLDYNTNLASNFRQEAVNNQQTAQNRLASLIGAGQTLNQNQQAQGNQVAANIGNQTIAGGNTQASAQLALGQTQANTFNQVGSTLGKALNSYLTMPQTPQAYIPSPTTNYTNQSSGLTYNLPGSGY